jgi:hypothetical protein
MSDQKPLIDGQDASYQGGYVFNYHLLKITVLYGRISPVVV